MPVLIAQKRNGNHVIVEVERWCPGCGVHIAVTGEHRPDCTTEPSPLICDHDDCDQIRLPSERSRQPWLYLPNTRTYLCPTHQKGTTA